MNTYQKVMEKKVTHTKQVESELIENLRCQLRVKNEKIQALEARIKAMTSSSEKVTIREKLGLLV